MLYYFLHRKGPAFKSMFKFYKFLHCFNFLWQVGIAQLFCMKKKVCALQIFLKAILKK